MFSQTPTPFVVDRLLQPILDGLVWAALLAFLFMVFLALVRHGRVDAPWAKRLFLDPVDRARAKRAEIEAEEDLGRDSGGAPPDPDGKGGTER